MRNKACTGGPGVPERPLGSGPGRTRQQGDEHDADHDVQDQQRPASTRRSGTQGGAGQGQQVLMDIRMPRVDGITAAKQLCAQPSVPKW